MSTPSFRTVFRPTSLAALLVGVTCLVVHAAEVPSWKGEYADKKFLQGQAVFQLSIEQSANALQVSFDAAYADGHGAAPEGQGSAKVAGNTLQFKFEDNFGNSGTGTITRTGDDIVVSMKPSQVADPRCLAFYREKMRLKRVGKK